MYGNLGGIAVGAGALAATGSDLRTMLIVVAACAVALGVLGMLRERASRRFARRTTGTAE